MSSEHKTPSYDDVSTRSLFVVGAVGVILVVVSILAVQAIYYKYERAEFVRKVVQKNDKEIEAIIAEQKARLTIAGQGAHPDLGEKSIPISQAMELVIKNYKSRQQTEATADNAAAREP